MLGGRGHIPDADPTARGESQAAVVRGEVGKILPRRYCQRFSRIAIPEPGRPVTTVATR